MNLILLFPDDFVEGAGHEDGGIVRLTGRRCRHVQEIQRAEVGDELCVGRIGGRIGRGRVIRIDADLLEMEVRLEREPPAPLPVTLLLALPRPLVLKRVLLGATAMGVKKILLFHCNRVERSFWNSKVLREDALPVPLVLGLEQSVDTCMPEVLLRTRFKSLVEDELADLAAGTLRLVAHPEAARPCPREVEGRVTLVVGPEGGFVPYEIEQLEGCGFSPVALGERILRVESAVPVLLARLF
ncbi:MAG: 16S rRNA (uracil(1498)-N(3))-methyltransferase [Deltaproteobacteria bacterium]|nr:16S rRNA (uracil(1498)-N(3))-methyltransferase [Deltaproteobacteria bacterium]